MEHRGLIHVDDEVGIAVSFLQNWTNVGEEIEGLALDLAGMTLRLVRRHAMREAVLRHPAGDGLLYCIFRLGFQLGNQ